MADKKNADSPAEAVEPQITETVASASAAASAPVAPAAKYDFTKLNTLAVVSIATAVTGFGAIAGVITGHIALTQIRQTGAKGRGLALAGVIVGYAGIAFALIGGVARVIAALVGPRYGVISIDGGVRHGNGNFGGMMGGWDDQNGQVGGPDNGFVNPGNGGMMGGWGTNPSPAPTAGVTPSA